MLSVADVEQAAQDVGVQKDVHSPRPA
jgi:hypothetical protein